MTTVQKVWRSGGGAESRPPTRGSAVVFVLLVLAVLSTGIVVSMGVTNGVQAQTVGLTFKRTSAFYAAEAGIQQALWNMNNNPSWLSTLPVTQTLSNGCSYTVSVATANPTWPATPLTVQSVGSSADGNAFSRLAVTITSTVTVPDLAVGGSLADSGTLTIAGTVQVVGNITRSGTMNLTTVSGQSAASLQSMGSFTSSGTFVVPGNLKLNGGITSSGTVTVSEGAQAGSSITHSGTWNVTGGAQAYDNPNLNISVPTVDTATLISEATADGTVIAGGAKSNLTIDFTKGPNHVLYIDSNITLSGTTTIIGSGTVIVAGTMSVSGTLGSSATPAPLNIVTTGNDTMSGNLYMQGSLCVGGTLTKSGSTAITGVVVVQSSVTGSGNIQINNSAPPSFVHFSGSGGSNIQASNFLSPIF